MQKIAINASIAAAVLVKAGLTPDTHADICFEKDNIIGTCSQERGEKRLYKAIAIMIPDNDIDPDDLEAMTITYETVKEIALSCDILYTDFGLQVHSTSFKHTPFDTQIRSLR